MSNQFCLQGDAVVHTPTGLRFWMQADGTPCCDATNSATIQGYDLFALKQQACAILQAERSRCV